MTASMYEKRHCGEFRTTAIFGAAAPAEFPLLDGAPEGIRTPNLLIRSQMLYPLSYGRRVFSCS